MSVVPTEYGDGERRRLSTTDKGILEIVIEMNNLTKYYGPVVAVEGLSLQIARGGVFGLLGPNGSGKTTTIGMVLSLVKPTRGSIRLFGQDVSGTYSPVRVTADWRYGGKPGLLSVSVWKR